MLLRTIKDIENFKDKKIIVRADLNVPIEDKNITDDTRIVRFAPTAKYLSDKGAKVIIVTHLGRPKGQKNLEYTTEILLSSLSDHIQKPVMFIPDVIGDNVKDLINKMNPSDICLLENVRFYKEEELNDENFSKQLAGLGDIFINDAFSAAHRAHASTEGITKFLPSYAGFLMQEELEALSKSVNYPIRPAVAIVGGSKVSTKISVLKNITSKVEKLVIGGAMANTFLLAKGIDIGASMVEMDMIDIAKDIMDEAQKNNCKIILPVDVTVAKELQKNTEYKVVSIDNIGKDDKIFDIGNKTLENLKEELKDIKTVLWNGPIGVFEVPPFNKGTEELALYVAKLTKEKNITSVAGGGDTVAALNNAGVDKEFSYISTAGGAFLEYLEGKELPAIFPLLSKKFLLHKQEVKWL